MVSKLKKWRAIFALDCHGGLLIQALTEEDALKKFQDFTPEELFHYSQVKKVRFLGIVHAQKVTNIKKTYDKF